MREKALSRLGRGRPNAQIRPVENAQRLKRWGTSEITRAISQAPLNRVS